jgi:DNA-binding MarR family transcriptional regulator
VDENWLSPEEQHAWRGYRRMRVLLDLQIARDLAQDDVLSTLSEAKGRRGRLVDLGAQMLWSKSRLSHQVTRMERRGLVAREECETDARGSVVTLTPAGVAAIEEAAPSHVASVRRHFIDLLTPEQLEALNALAQQVVDHLADS